MTLLILGGTGTLGRQIVRKALENGFQVRCIVRNKRAANFLKEWGAELVYGDLTIPETLPLSFQGVTAIIDASTTKPEDNTELVHVDWYGKLIVIELSKYAQLKRFIFLSILNSEKYPYITLMQMKYRIEKFIKSSTIPFTIFKYAGFFQGLIYQYAIPILEQKSILVTLESPTIAYIDTQDAAFFCIKSLSIKETENKIFATGSSQAWKSEEIIELCEKLSGQKAKTQTVPVFLLKVFRQITGFFEWSLKISDRLAFIEVINNTQSFTSSIQDTYNSLDINKKEVLELDFYFREYFEMMLTLLEKLNAGQIKKKSNFYHLTTFNKENMNHAIFVVKVIEKPVHLIYKECQSMEIKVKFPAPRKKNSINELTLLLWGDYKGDFVKYYKAQDYLIIEGTLTSKGYANEENEINETKIIVKKLYPFLLI